MVKGTDGKSYYSDTINVDEVTGPGKVAIPRINTASLDE